MRRHWLSRAAYGGMFVFGIVMALLGAVLPVVSTRLGFELAQAGNLFLAMNCAMLAAMLALGPLMDRFGKKPALAGGALLAGLALALIAAAPSYRWLTVAIALLGAGGGALNGATNTLIADLHEDPREKNSALNLLGVFFGFGALSIPFVIGSLLEILGLSAILALASALSLAPTACLALRFPPPKRSEGVPWRETARLARDPLVLMFGFLLFFQSGNEFILGGYTSTYLMREAGASIRSASYLLAAYWGAIMLARVVSSRLLLRVSGPTVVMASALGSAAGVALLASARTQAMAALAVVLVGASFASIYPTVLGLAGARFAAWSGTVFGILFGIALAGGMIMPWAVGQLAQAHGLRPALLVAAANALAIFALQMLIARRLTAPCGRGSATFC